ncbi:MAG: hypothetical protein AAF632_11745 [Bacteroidota bacterium]
MPTTELELEQRMKENCYNFNGYSINGNSIHEGFGIDKLGSLFAWYYTERGNRDNLKYFQSEKEIVEYAFKQIKSDMWAKVHRVGFTVDKVKIDELAQTLKKRNIEFLQDSIPYYGSQSPVYGIFVFGCSNRRVIDLKDKYHQ